MRIFNSHNFTNNAKFIIRKQAFLNDSVHRSFFGIGVVHCEKVWNMICLQYPQLEFQPKHLLWGLLFLKTYQTEEIHSSICGVTRTTFRYWSWVSIEVMYEIKVVSFF